MTARSSALVALAALALVALGGCVASPHRGAVGAYCHDDDYCEEGLRCVTRVCTRRPVPPPDGGTSGGGGGAGDAAGS